MWNPFKRSEKPIEQVVEVEKVEKAKEVDPLSEQIVFQYDEFADYSDAEKLNHYRECASTVQMEAFELTARSLIRKYGYNIIRDLSNAPMQTTEAELERQKIIAIEDFVSEMNIKASYLKRVEDERPPAISEQEYFNNHNQ